MTTTSRAGAPTLVGALAYLVLTGSQVTNPAFDDELTSVTDYVNDGSFLAGLVLTIPGLWAVYRTMAAPTVAIVLAIAGQSLVAVGVLPALITGTSPAWFPLLGLPGNLLAWVGPTGLAVWAWRRRTLPRWVAVLLALSVPIGVGVSEYGGSIVSAVVWCYLGAQLLRPSAAGSSFG